MDVSRDILERLMVRTARTGDLEGTTRAAVVSVCREAHRGPDLENLFSYLPPEGVRVLAWNGDALVGHAVLNTRWLQPAGSPVLRTAYVDVVVTARPVG